MSGQVISLIKLGIEFERRSLTMALLYKKNGRAYS